MTSSGPIKVGIVAGEESGDILGADLIAAIKAMTGRDVELTGIGGSHLAGQGLDSLFDPGEIALIGLTEVIRRLPALIARIGQVARAIVAARPDIVIIIDSPDFTHRVARKIRTAAPGIPIVDYVCPSVWAWRPQRAKTMRAYVDHVLCLLPFEVDALRRLDGPAATYVGHRLTGDQQLQAAYANQRERVRNPARPNLVLLPGSRRSEVRGLLTFFRDTVAALHEEGLAPQLKLPTVGHVEGLVRDAVSGWPWHVEITTGAEARHLAFGEADAALAASGTVTLELALAGVPLVSTYKGDVVLWLMRSLIKTWSASLPNLIADRPVVPELYNDMLRPKLAARYLMALIEPGAQRDAQLAGFSIIRERMETPRPSGEIAAEAVLNLLPANTKP